MFDKNVIALLVLVLFANHLFSAPKYPFPQNGSYRFGINKSGADPNDIQSAYTVFKNNHYEESGEYARIKWDSPAFTVSEGIGYGMLIMVYMDNAANNTRSKFDKLWNYYQRWKNEHNLMHWKINGFNNVAEANAATDADLDVALALLMAYKQWDDQKYLNDVKNLIGNIWNHEVNNNRYLKPGDMWDNKKNPSYFSTAALELFKEVDSQDWSSVINNSYDLIKKCRNANTGLVPDWCQENGSPLGEFKYDAIRTPWRIAMAYVWFGHNDAKDIAGKMAAWITQKTGGNPKSIVDGYALNGNEIGRYTTPTFLGCFSAAGLVESSHQSWVDNGYDLLKRYPNDDGYYNECFQVMILLLLSGNMPNFWDVVTGISNPPVSGNTINKIHITASPSTNRLLTVRYTIPQNSEVHLGLYTTRGKRVKDIYCGYMKAGCHTAVLDLSKETMASGMYIIATEAQRHREK